jgi:hypothetical protein
MLLLPKELLPDLSMITALEFGFLLALLLL